MTAYWYKGRCTRRKSASIIDQIITKFKYLSLENPSAIMHG
jgi:hypothetical protein